MMIKYCYANVEKLRQWKKLNKFVEEDEEDEDGAYVVGVAENEDDYFVYHFSDINEYNFFIDMLESGGYDYDILSEDDFEEDDEY